MPFFAYFQSLVLPVWQLGHGVALVLYERHRLWAYVVILRIAIIEG